jgi:hypothetical protein
MLARDRERGWHRIRIFHLASGVTYRRKEIDMRPILYTLAATALVAFMATPILAHANETGMHSVTVGNTTIEGGGGSTADLNVARYQAWDQFRSSHPRIVREIRHHPRIVGSEAFVNRHPQLKQLFEAHEGMQQDMLRHPGNYVVPKMG